MEANYFKILYWVCHTLTWTCHGCTCVPHPEPPSHLPPQTIPLSHPSAPAPSILYHASNLDCFKFCWHYLPGITSSVLFVFCTGHPSNKVCAYFWNREVTRHDSALPFISPHPSKNSSTGVAGTQKEVKTGELSSSSDSPPAEILFSFYFNTLLRFLGSSFSHL